MWDVQMCMYVCKCMYIILIDHPPPLPPWGFSGPTQTNWNIMNKHGFLINLNWLEAGQLANYAKCNQEVEFVLTKHKSSE